MAFDLDSVLHLRGDRGRHEPARRRAVESGLQRSSIDRVVLGLAGLYVLLAAPFVAVIQIIVYTGAIMVLFLFVVMLLNAPREEIVQSGMLESGGTRALGACLAIAFAAELAWALSARARGQDVGGERAGMGRVADRAKNIPGVHISVRSHVDADPGRDGRRHHAGGTAPAEKRPPNPQSLIPDYLSTLRISHGLAQPLPDPFGRPVHHRDRRRAAAAQRHHHAAVDRSDAERRQPQVHGLRPLPGIG